MKERPELKSTFPTGFSVWFLLRENAKDNAPKEKRAKDAGELIERGKESGKRISWLRRL